MPVEQTDKGLILHHPKGASATILYYGATVISWKSATKQNSTIEQRLFVSSTAILDGSKPVRGGIPVVFPCFGPPTHQDHIKLPQHGFTRSENWSYEGPLTDNDSMVSVKLVLEPTARISSIFPHPFHLTYIITLTEFNLSTEIHVKNTSAVENIEFQALFHNYILAPSDKVLVTPLQKLFYYDKTESTEEAKATPKIETRAGVDVHKFTDSVYENGPQKYEVTWPGGGIFIKTSNLKDVVVWNPQAEAGSKMGDMHHGGWNEFICVEPGYVRGFEKVSPGQTWVGRQTLSVVQEESGTAL